MHRECCTRIARIYIRRLTPYANRLYGATANDSTASIKSHRAATPFESSSGVKRWRTLRVHVELLRCASHGSSNWSSGRQSYGKLSK